MNCRWYSSRGNHTRAFDADDRSIVLPKAQVQHTWHMLQQRRQPSGIRLQ